MVFKLLFIKWTQTKGVAIIVTVHLCIYQPQRNSYIEKRVCSDVAGHQSCNSINYSVFLAGDLFLLLKVGSQIGFSQRYFNL